jgi:hypothetical protein
VFREILLCFVKLLLQEVLRIKPGMEPPLPILSPKFVEQDAAPFKSMNPEKPLCSLLYGFVLIETNDNLFH